MIQSFDEFEESVRKGQAFSKQRVDRLTQVLNEYYVYKKESWLDLVDEAVIWAIIALSDSDNVSQCETLFFANVNELYVSTSEAERTLSVDERRRIQVKATKRGCTKPGPKQKLKANVSKKDVEKLKGLNAPAFVVGVDIVAEKAYLIRITNASSGAIRGIPTTHPIDCTVIKKLWQEIDDYWINRGSMILTSSQFA